MSSSYNFEKVHQDRLNLSQVNADTLNASNVSSNGPVGVGRFATITEADGATATSYAGQIAFIVGGTKAGKYVGTTGGAWFDLN